MRDGADNDQVSVGEVQVLSEEGTLLLFLLFLLLLLLLLLLGWCVNERFGSCFRGFQVMDGFGQDGGFSVMFGQSFVQCLGWAFRSLPPRSRLVRLTWPT